MRFFIPCFALLAFSIGFAAPAMAATSAAVSMRDPLVLGAMQCTKYFPRYERQYAIPTHLLSAIASTESGRYHQKLKIRLPWPWTVMSGGVGKFYDTKQEAVAAVKKLKAAGTKNIDVGCMQVNLQHHGDHFANVEQAFEPEYNVNYAAVFLRRLYDDEHSWKKAASDYHSKTPALGAKYIGMVYDSWFTIIEKLRAARLAVPESSVAGINELKGKNSKSLPASAKVEPYPVEAAKPAYVAPRMNSIKISSAQQDTTPDALSYARRDRDHGVLMVTPDTASSTVPQPVQAQKAIETPVQNVPMTLADNRYTTAAVSNPAPAVAPAAPVQSLALTETGSRATASVSLPINGMAQAAVAPVTGVANAVLSSATDALDQGMKRSLSIPIIAMLIVVLAKALLCLWLLMLRRANLALISFLANSPKKDDGHVAVVYIGRSVFALWRF